MIEPLTLDGSAPAATPAPDTGDGFTPGILQRQCLDPGIPSVPEPSETLLLLAGCLAVIFFASIFPRIRRPRL